MGKVFYDAPHKSGTPSPAKPGASKILFSNKPSGTKGSSKGSK